MMIIRKAMRVILLLQGIVLSSQVFSQQEDSATIMMNDVADPSKNRLFIMPTGHIATEGTLSITSANLSFFNLEYTPTDYLQVDASCIVPLFSFSRKSRNEKHYSLSLKARLIRNFGIIQGISVGGDVGITGRKGESNFHNKHNTYYDGDFDQLFAVEYKRGTPLVGSMNISLSIGVPELQLHTNIAHIFYSKTTPYKRFGFAEFEFERYDYSPLEKPYVSYYQLGLEYQFLLTSSGVGFKVIEEVFKNNTQPFYYFHTGGLRMYSRSFSMDIGIISDEDMFIWSGHIVPYGAIKYTFW